MQDLLLTIKGQENLPVLIRLRINGQTITKKQKNINCHLLAEKETTWDLKQSLNLEK